MLHKSSLFDIGITTADRHTILEYVFDFIERTSGKCLIVTPNPEIIMFAQQDTSYQQILNQAQLALPDGVGVLMAARILGKPIHHKIAGVDLMQDICHIASDKSKKDAKKPITVGFLGGRGNVAEKTAECLRQRFHGLEVVYTSSLDPTEKTALEIMKERQGKRPIDILFVAYGFPKQEIWAHQYLPRLPVRVVMTVGGAFDYLSGTVPRAPFFIRSVGLEWLYRLIRQPWRLKRQKALLSFVLLILRQRFVPPTVT